MQFRGLLKYLVLTVVAALLFGAIAFFAAGPDRIYETLAGPADMGPVEFATLKKTREPNQALVCTADLCRNEKADIESPVFEMPADKLKANLLKALENEERLERVDDGEMRHKLRFVQRSQAMRFPDTIRVEIVPLDDKSSTLAIYSQSQLGQSDFGVNLERVERWLAKLENTGAGG